MKLVHEKLSYEILGALFDVQREIGYGHRESVYQRAVAVCLQHRGISFEQQVKYDICLGTEKLGKAYLDFLIDDKVVLEIKARAHFSSSDYRQVHRYLKTSGLELAILAAFTPTGARFKRVLNVQPIP